jgi:chromosome segregation ATPase
MVDIAGIEARLAAALDRVGRAAGRLPEAQVAAAAAAEAERLRGALAAEKAANADLTERVRALRERQEQAVEALERRVLRLQERAAEQEGEIARLRRANDRLREAAGALRAAAAEGVVPAEGVDRALAAELDATRAAQAADRAELDAILAELRPLIEEKADV